MMTTSGGTAAVEKETIRTGSRKRKREPDDNAKQQNVGISAPYASRDATRELEPQPERQSGREPKAKQEPGTHAAPECECGKFFFAEMSGGGHGELLLECCHCGREWRRSSEGVLTPLPPRVNPETADNEIDAT